MRWTYAKTVPEKLYVACSGGVDSVAAAAILAEWRDVSLVHFGHADHASAYEREVVYELSRRLSVGLITKDSDQNCPNANKEHVWRTDRYSWFHTLDRPVVVAHTLDDAVEWYMITCLRGRGEYVRYSNKNVIRPFLLTEKKDLVNYATVQCLDWWEDPSNTDTDFSLRSKVRHTLIPVAVDCQPGLYNTVKRNLRNKMNEPDNE